MTLSDTRRGASLLLIARAVALPLGTVTNVVLARWLGRDGYGEYAAALATVTFATSINLAGLDQLLLQGRLSSAAFRTLLAQWAGLSLLLSVVVVAVYPGMTGTARWTGVLLAGAAAFTIYSTADLVVPVRSLLYAKRALRELVLKVMAFAGIGSCALLFRGTPATAGYAGLAAGLVGCLLLRLAGSRDPASTGPVLRLPAALRGGAGFASASALFAISRQAPLLVLIALSTRANIADLRVALTVYAAMQIAPATLNHDVLRPRLYAAAEGWDRLLRRTFQANVAMGLLGGVLVACLASTAVRVLFGPEYTTSAEALMVLCLGFPLFCLNAWADTLLIVDGQQRAVVKRLASALAVVIAASVVLQGSGAPGVASAMLIGELASLLVVLVPTVHLLRRLRPV